MSYIDVTGKTEDEALRKGLEQLGMDRDDVSVSILERAKTGFLGIGATPARIRITYGPEEADVAAPAEVKIIPETPAAPKAEPKPVPTAATVPVPRRRSVLPLWPRPSTCPSVMTIMPSVSSPSSPVCSSIWTVPPRSRSTRWRRAATRSFWWASVWVS